MTISIEQKQLQASCDLIAKDKEIESLKAVLSKQRASLVLKDQQIATLQASLQRARLPFKRDQTTPALLQRQAE